MIECPYADKQCPKVIQLEERVDKIEGSIEKTADRVTENGKLLQYLLGIVVAGFGLTGGMIIW